MNSLPKLSGNIGVADNALWENYPRKSFIQRILCRPFERAFPARFSHVLPGGVLNVRLCEVGDAIVSIGFCPVAAILNSPAPQKALVPSAHPDNRRNSRLPLVGQISRGRSMAAGRLADCVADRPLGKPRACAPGRSGNTADSRTCSRQSMAGNRRAAPGETRATLRPILSRNGFPPPEEASREAIQ